MLIVNNILSNEKCKEMDLILNNVHMDNCELWGTGIVKMKYIVEEAVRVSLCDLVGHVLNMVL